MKGYFRYRVKKNGNDAWRINDKVKLVLLSFKEKITPDLLCKINEITPDQLFEWREKFIRAGRYGLMTEGATEREHELTKKVDFLQETLQSTILENIILKRKVNKAG
ncbi:MAG: hypothetical protein JW881_01860 [Spirochaetales bacterium]|nr:hypothetical protein [Spirochaetales bacterium]